MKSLRLKKYSNKSKIYRYKVPLDNLVDKDVQSMLLPLNLMHNILLCPKYRIKDNYIYPNSRTVKLVSLSGAIISIFLLLSGVYELYFDKSIRKYISLTFINSNVDVILYSFGFIINYCVNVLPNKRNISFVLKFQDVHRFLNENTNFKRFVFCNWISVVLVLSFNIFTAIYFCIHLKLASIYFFCGLAVICFDANIIDAIRFIKLLSEKVNLWNIQAENMQKTDYNDSETHCNRMFQAYVNILECYDIFMTSYQEMIVFHTIEFFYHALVKFQISLKVFKIAALMGTSINHAAWFSFISLYIWVMKSFILEIMLSACCEKFYIAMNNVLNSCALILKSNCTDAEKKLCKNIIRLHEATFEKMNACRMFYVDATFPIKMMVLHSDYTIVLLQFAFL